MCLLRGLVEVALISGLVALFEGLGCVLPIMGGDQVSMALVPAWVLVVPFGKVLVVPVPVPLPVSWPGILQ